MPVAAGADDVAAPMEVIGPSWLPRHVIIRQATARHYAAGVELA